MHETRWFVDDDGVKWTSYIKEDDAEAAKPYVRFDSTKGSRRGGDSPELLEEWRHCSAWELQQMCEKAAGIG
ncbi:MAG: hypothetical protein ACRENI_00090 [Gemmatimonadaceae bacterium]